MNNQKSGNNYTKPNRNVNKSKKNSISNSLAKSNSQSSNKAFNKSKRENKNFDSKENPNFKRKNTEHEPSLFKNSDFKPKYSRKKSVDNQSQTKKTNSTFRNKRDLDNVEITEIRLNKFISDSGLCARRKADELIKSGAVKVNGAIIIDMGTRVKPSDLVTVNGDPISYQKHLTYILLNKPKDSLCTSDDDKGRKTVFDIIKSPHRLFSVGRLDRNTTGVLLLTNDGELSSRLTHPSYEIERTYNVSLDKKLTLADARKIASGVELEDGKTGEAEIIILPTDKTKAILTLKEGKNREVRRMFEALGYDVKKLDRKYFAGLSNKGMKRGEFRILNRDELLHLKKLTKMS